MIEARRRIARWLLYSIDARRTRVGWRDLSELAIVAFAFLCYFLVRGAVAERAEEAFANARWIVELQRSLGVFVEPAFQSWVLEHEFLVRFLNFVYFWLDLPLIAVAGIAMLWKRRRAYMLTRDAILISGGMALAVYWAWPVAPPRFLPEWGFVDTLAVYNNLSYQAQTMQPFVNPFAAVPSLHVGWAMLLAAGAFVATRNLALRLGAIALFVLQSISVVGTGNHYLFDGAAGIVVCALALAAAIWMQRRGYPAARAALAREAGLLRAGSEAGAARPPTAAARPR